MAKFESESNFSGPALDPSEAEVDVTTSKKLEDELRLEELEKSKSGRAQEQVSKEPGLSPDEQLKNLENEAGAKQEEMARLSKSIEGTKFALNASREKLGLPSNEEDPPSVLSNKDQLEKLKSEQETLEKQREDLINQQEKERLIREEIVKILQEKLDELFKEFEGLNRQAFESIFMNGKTPEGRMVESKSMGSLEPEVAQSLARAFKEGVTLIPKILEVLPELLKRFEEDLTKEAIERVDKKLEEEKRQLEEAQKKEEELEEPKLEEKLEGVENEIAHGEVKLELNSIEGENVESPKA